MEYREGPRYFTKNNFFVYQNYYHMVKVANSGYTSDLIDFVENGNPYKNLSAFAVALKKVKDFRRVVVEGPADKDFTVHLSEYRYNEPFVQIYMALRPEVLDRTIYSVTLKNELDYDMMLYDAINDTKNELMRKWEVIREKIVTPEYINDLDELIDALAYATLNGEFECKKDT